MRSALCEDHQGGLSRIDDSLRRRFVEEQHSPIRGPLSPRTQHQGLENPLIIPLKAAVNTEGKVERRERLGGY
jgi:hypothetical protein